MGAKTLDDIPDENIIRHEWDSFEAFVEHVRRDVPLSGLNGRLASIELGRDFTGTDTFEEAINLAMDGWPQGLERMKAMRGKLRQLEPQQAERHVATHCESGDEVDIGRFVSGEPECMLEYAVTHVPASGRVVKLVVNTSASAAVSTESMFLRGAAAVMLADLIEQSGLRVEVVICLASRSASSNDHAVQSNVTVKRADQPLELDRLAFMLAHASVHRRFGFRLKEQLTQEEYNRHVGPMYGYPANGKFEEAGTIVVDSMQYGFGNCLNNEQQCIAFVNAMIERFTEQEAA